MWSRSKALEAIGFSGNEEELEDGLSFLLGAMITKLK